MSPVRRGRKGDPFAESWALWTGAHPEPRSPWWFKAWFVFCLALVLTVWGAIIWGVYEGIMWLRRN